MILQAPSAVVLIRPHDSHPNPETKGDNAFQSDAVGSADGIAIRAREKFDGVVAKLRAIGGYGA